jgi:hypothetical protein
MTEKLHIRIAPDGTIEVRTENVEPADVARLVPVLEAMLQAKALSARTEPTPRKPTGKAKRATPVGRR